MGDTTELIEAKEAENSSWARTAKDLFAGAAGGVAQVLLGEFLKIVAESCCLLLEGDDEMEEVASAKGTWPASSGS